MHHGTIWRSAFSRVVCNEAWSKESNTHKHVRFWPLSTALTSSRHLSYQVAMLFFKTLVVASTYATATLAVTLPDYEYVVIGSGAGGGPLAARLALAGHKTLLIEAGDDQGNNVNYTVPAYQAKSTEDPAISWDFFVRHYSDDARQKLDYKLTYNLPNGGEYTGLNPPPGATIKGILYPRAGTLGGCTAHNALVSIYPDRDDFDNIAALTGDSSWSADNMRKYFIRMEANHYNAIVGHGLTGWLGISEAPINLVSDTQLLAQLVGASQSLGNTTNTIQNIGSLTLGDANADSSSRDSTPALYQIPISSTNGRRNSVREFLLSVQSATNLDGTKKYPLDIRLNCFVTKVTFTNNGSTPRATGVNFLDGKSLFRADPRWRQAAPGVAGSVKATREVIVAGGSYNSPMILKHSGIGPASELKALGITVVKDLPGVGKNLQDHYEVAVQATTPMDYAVLNGCNFAFAGDGKPIPATSDPCYNNWAAFPNIQTYASSGFAGAAFFKSSTTPDGNYDLFAFGGPVNFRGYFPGYSYNATQYHNWWTWALLKSHPRNQAGTVTLATNNPLDLPNIEFNYFDTGSGDYNADLETIYEAVGFARGAFQRSGLNLTEVLPGSQVQSKGDIESYIKNTAWGHHCSSTCPIGTDSDPNAVLDSSFRVRGVQGLRVVDASVYPKIPGTFTVCLLAFCTPTSRCDVLG